MKLLFYAPYSAPADAQLVEVAHGLGHEVTYLCTGPTLRSGLGELDVTRRHFPPDPAPDSGLLMRLRQRMHRGMLRELNRFRIKEELQAASFDAVIANDLELGVDAVKDAFRQTKRPLPIIAVSHGSDVLHVPARSPASRAQVIEAATGVKAVVCFSRSHEAALQALLDGKPVNTDVFPLWVDANRFAPRAGSPPKRVFAPRGSREVYRPALVLRAFAEATKGSGEEWRLTMLVNPSHAKTLKSLATSLGCDHRIDWLHTPLPHAEMPARYRDHAIVLQATEDESFGLSVIEAMASGCALCKTATGPDTELLGDLGAGQVAGAGGDDLGAALARLCADLPKLAAFGAKNRAKVEQSFDRKPRIGAARETFSQLLDGI